MMVAAKRAAILGTDLPDLKVSLDSLAILEQAMRHFYIKAMVEKSLGERADWKAVDAAMVQAAAMAESRRSPSLPRRTLYPRLVMAPRATRMGEARVARSGHPRFRTSPVPAQPIAHSWRIPGPPL